MQNLPTYDEFINEAKKVIILDQEQVPSLKEVSKITDAFIKSDIHSLAKKHGMELITYKAKSGLSGKSTYTALIDPNVNIPAVGWLKRPENAVIVLARWGNEATKLDGPVKVEDNLNNTARPDNSYNKIDLGGETINASGNVVPIINKVRSDWQYYGNQNDNIVLTNDLVKSYQHELPQLIKYLDQWLTNEYPKWKESKK